MSRLARSNHVVRIRSNAIDERILGCAQKMKSMPHIIRTVLMVASLALLIAVILYLSPNWLGLIASGALLAGFIYYSAYWHASSAPVAEPVHRVTWQSSAAEPMETVVEKAIVGAAIDGTSSVRHESMRILIRNQERELTRKVVGDDAIFLGYYGNKLWFYIADRFYAKVDGLTTYSIETAEVAFNRPLATTTYVGRVRKRGGVIKVEQDGVEQELDLKTLCSP